MVGIGLKEGVAQFYDLGYLQRPETRGEAVVSLDNPRVTR